MRRNTFDKLLGTAGVALGVILLAVGRPLTATARHNSRHAAQAGTRGR